MLVYEIDNVLYSDAEVFGENKPVFCMPLPSDDAIDFQISVDDGIVPELWALVDNEVVYKLPPTLIEDNYYWLLSLPAYPLLFNKCVSFIIIDTVSQEANKGAYNSVILESEPVCINAFHDSLIKVTYRNSEEYDTVLFDGNYTGILYIPATFIQEPLKEESKTYIRSNGQTVKLSSRQYSNYFVKTDYLPRYFHEIISLILSLDNVIFDTTLMVSNEGYTYTNVERYSLSQGGVVLSRALYNKLNSNCS